MARGLAWALGRPDPTQCGIEEERLLAAIEVFLAEGPGEHGTTHPSITECIVYADAALIQYALGI